VDIVGNRTLYSIFRAHAGTQPDRLWLSYEATDESVSQWTFSEFLDSVHQAVGLLQDLGVGTGDVIDLHLTNHPAFPQVILAASYLGAIALPTSPSCSTEELRYFLEHSEAKLVITQAQHLASVEAVAKETCSILLLRDGYPPDSRYRCYEAELERQSGTIAEGEGSTERVVQLLYTSGTTSRPKAVMLTNANFIYGSEVFRAATGLRHEDHHLIALPLYHSAAQCHALWPSVIAGCSVSILSRFSASRFFEQATTHGGTMAALFGSPLRMLLNQPERATDRTHRLRNVTYAQNLTPTQYEDWHRRFGAPLQQLWGMTEICALPIMSPLSGERRLMAMGRPVLGYEAKIVDDSGRELPPHVPGQLIVRGRPGHSLMKGYLKDGAATEKTLRQMQGETWLFSGDTATCDQDGFFYFLDRSNDMIKRSGLNISTSEIESVIAALDGVADVCVCGLPDPMRDESVAAVVVRKPQTQITTDDIRSHCAAHLAPHKVPERIEFFAILPRTSVGKVRKNIVREQLLTGKPETKADA
jgi:crotonobetaine/carnitine-CoA ligase